MAWIRCPRRRRTSPTSTRLRAPTRTRSHCAHKHEVRRPRRRGRSTRKASPASPRTAKGTGTRRPGVGVRGLGLEDEAESGKPNGGAIALGEPLGMSAARLAGAVALELKWSGARYGLATMCVGVGQGAALALERV